jgi:hypothetical protein
MIEGVEVQARSMRDGGFRTAGPQRLRARVDDLVEGSRDVIQRGREALDRSRARLERAEAALSASLERTQREQADVDRQVAYSGRAAGDTS